MVGEREEKGRWMERLEERWASDTHSSGRLHGVEEWWSSGQVVVKWSKNGFREKLLNKNLA